MLKTTQPRPYDFPDFLKAVLDMQHEVDMRLPGDQERRFQFASFRQLMIAILYITLSMYQKANCKSSNENILNPLHF
jgi:hypothetical protein